MTSNNLNLNPKVSGRNIHRFLIKEVFRIFKHKGYKVEIEKLIGKRRVDVYVEKRDEKIAIECFVKPTISHVEKKQKLKDYVDKLIIVFPSYFIPSFPIEDYGEILKINIPINLQKKEGNITIQISDELWEELNKKKKKGETFEDVIWKEIKKND